MSSSRIPSRRPSMQSGISTPHSGSSSASLLPPPLRAQPSQASISVFTSPPSPPAIRVEDAGGGILLADADAESDLAEEDLVTVQAQPEEADVRAKRALREQLHTLMSRSLTAGMVVCAI
jgi:hypothetical protein